MAVKYKAYLQKMYTEHQDLFDRFEDIHHQYQMDKLKFQEEFNSQGIGVMRVVEEWENRLCKQMEKGKNSTYSLHLADKFRAELRVRFPLIDFVGVTTKSSPKPAITTISLD